MSAIHAYLLEELRKGEQNSAVKVVQELLHILEKEEVESPRSVQVRLYHLLQKSQDTRIRTVWAKFGADLMSGIVATKDPNRKTKAATPLWKLAPSLAHEWAARLTVQGRAVVVSLNYDGLTRKAMESIATEIMQPPPENRRSARILSSADEIRSFFTGIESDVSAVMANNSVASAKQIWRPVPIIKFRGDVFHAMCENGRCSACSKPAPLYDLLDLKDEAGEPSETAIRQLRCPSCGRERDLQISFPGVYGKEKEIDEALTAFHEIAGCNIAGVIFLGFSGKWDEALVEYLVERAKSLEAPVISLSKTPTPAIEQTCRRHDTSENYLYLPCESHGKTADGESSAPVFEGVLNSVSPPNVSGKDIAPSKANIEFPSEAFFIFGKNPPASFELALPSETPHVTRNVKIESKSNDSFTGLAGFALHTEALRKLDKCSQLGLKADFVFGADKSHHSRLNHSAAAAMISMLWYEALVPKRSKQMSWAWTEETKIALELAVLFHDARHLPFSHMMEEVFKELNWGHIPLLAWPDIPRYVKEVPPDLQGDFGQELKKKLKVAGVEVDDLGRWWKKTTALMDSSSGVPWLEAIADSALDADKIEYLFHDTQVTGQNVRLTKWHDWFEAFLSGQSLTPEGLIRLEGQSCIAALELLQERLHLYRHLYLAPELRALETLARYIVLTWLKWKVPDRLDESDLAKMSGYDLENSLRGAKSKIAGDLMWEMFFGSGEPKRELAGLEEMVLQLKSLDVLDEAAVVWLEGMWRHLAQFTNPEKQPSMQHARKVYSDMNPIGPFYVHQRHEKTIRTIIRLWRVHYPLVALVDVVRFPRFLSTPENRQKRFGGALRTAEHFLVPSVHPTEWHRKLPATTPLHRCDFRAFEQPVLQLVVFDPWGEPSGGSPFLYQMLRREFEREGIEISESPEQVKK
jgi:HD superfamily phosphohydrolase